MTQPCPRRLGPGLVWKPVTHKAMFLKLEASARITAVIMSAVHVGLSQVRQFHLCSRPRKYTGNYQYIIKALLAYIETAKSLPMDIMFLITLEGDQPFMHGSRIQTILWNKKKRYVFLLYYIFDPVTALKPFFQSPKQRKFWSGNVLWSLQGLHTENDIFLMKLKFNTTPSVCVCVCTYVNIKWNPQINTVLPFSSSVKWRFISFHTEHLYTVHHGPHCSLYSTVFL